MRIISRPRVIATLAAVVALFAAGHPANAQTTQSTLPSYKPLPSFSVRVGTFLPENTLMRKDVGTTLYAGGIDYVFSRTGPIDEWIISADYIDRGSGQSMLRMFPVTVGGIHYGSVGDSTMTRTYLGYGVGGYFTSANVLDNLGFVSNNKTILFGGYLNAGMDFKRNVFVDLRYHLVSSLGPTNPSGFELTAGIRF